MLITAKNKLVIGVVKPILRKLWPSYGRTNQPKLTENDITTLWPFHLYNQAMAIKHILNAKVTLWPPLWPDWYTKTWKCSRFLWFRLNILTLQHTSPHHTPQKEIWSYGWPYDRRPSYGHLRTDRRMAKDVRIPLYIWPTYDHVQYEYPWNVWPTYDISVSRRATLWPVKCATILWPSLHGQPMTIHHLHPEIL